MTPEQLELLKYPIGKHHWPAQITTELFKEWITEIETFPNRLEALVMPFSEKQLNTAYRPGGWTVRQVVHHVADSHVNSYIRYKWTLTEDKPVIKAYHEDRWAQLPDYSAPIAPTLAFLKALHTKWVLLLKSLSESDLQRTFIHPESKKEISLRALTGMYAWHCRHHYAHIEHLAKRHDWI